LQSFKIIFFIIFSYLICFQPIIIQAQETRPKIGIALSGGGARGIAHVGVLKALEELRVPIDYIAGTSMGSIAGGLYASGLSAEAIRRILEQTDWESIFNLKTERNQLSYREKQNQRRLFQMELGLDNNYSFSASAGLVGGQNLFLALKRITKGIHTDDFSKLPIPFKAVAVDINTAESYLLETGDLALALRASMAVPFAFAPVKIDGHLLVDGGILNNLPVDVVRAMGADIVIAVNISTPLEEIESNSSFLTVALQSLDTALIQNTRRALENADIIITPKLKNYGFTDFQKGNEMVAKGYEAVKKKAALFKGLSLTPAAYARYRANVEAKKLATSNSITPRFIKFRGNKRTSTGVLRGRLNNLIGHKLKIADIEAETKRLMSLNDFEQITYQIIENKQGQKGLLFDVREKRWGPSYFRFGLNANTTFNDKLEFSILLHHERLNMTRFGAEWVSEIEIGSGYRLFSEFYRPLDYRREYFIAPYAEFNRVFMDVFKNKQGIGEYDLKRLNLGFDFGFNFDNVAELRTGFAHKRVVADLRLGNPDLLPIGNIYENLLKFSFGYDTLDDNIFPKHGTKINLTTEFSPKLIGLNNNYQKLMFSIHRVFPINQQFTLTTNANIFTFIDTNPPKYEQFSIGGINYLAGYPEGDIIGKHALFLQMGWIFDPVKEHNPLSMKWLGLLHFGNAWDNNEDIRINNLLFGGLGGVAWNTPLGSLFLGAGYTSGGALNYYLSLGQVF
jgi:NTE family protein